MKSGLMNILIDESHGSSGKGKVSAYLADKYKARYVSSSNYPNAGHSLKMSNGYIFVAKAIPTALGLHACMGRDMIGFISPGSGFFPSQLYKEWVHTGKPQLFVHSRASIVTPDHARREREGNESTKHIASTMQGSGTAIADKVLRKADCILAGTIPMSEWDLGPEDLSADLKSEFLEKVKVVDALEFRNMTHAILSTDGMWLHEGSQGYALSIDHGTHFPNCLSSDSRVLMRDGKTLKIKDLKNHIGEEVLSKTDDGNLVYKKIINWWKNPLNEREWYNIVTETSSYNSFSKQWTGPKFTGDHKVQTPQGKKKVSELSPGDKIFVNESELTGDGLQIFLGSILGDGTVPNMKKNKRRATLQITHGEKQTGYLKAKVDILKKYIGGSIREYTYGENSFKPGNKSTRYSSSHSISVMRLATSLGCVGKKDPNFDAIVDLLDWRGMAIWFQDDGSYKQGGNGKDVYFFTNGFKKSSVEELALKLRNKFNLNFNMHLQKRDGKEYPTLHLSRKDINEFFDNISKYVHPNLSYKLPEGHEASWDWQENDHQVCTTETVIEVVKCRRRKNRGESSCYDIEVEDTHNFFVANDKGYFNVENCTSRNCSVQAAMDHMAVPPQKIGDVYMNMRSFPIRVGNVVEGGQQLGYSGDFLPDQKELTWDEIAKISGMPEEEAKALTERERTTVTKRVRRVATRSDALLKDAVRVNGVTKLSMNFVQYWNWNDAGLKGGKEAFAKLSKETRAQLDHIEELVGIPVTLIGTGANHDEIIDLDL